MEQNPQRVRAVVFDSNRMSTQLLADALTRNRQLEVIPAFSVIELERENADVVLISARQDGELLKGCELVRSVNSSHPRTRIIVLLEESTQEAVLESFRSGARGVFCRRDSAQMLCKCVISVHRGQVWASSSEIDYLLRAVSEPVRIRLVDAKGKVLLSNREQDVVRKVIDGLSNREIAEQLQLSEHTIKNYLFRIFDKLGISNRVELILYVLSSNGMNAQQGSAHSMSRPEKADLLAWCREEIERGSIAPLLLAEQCLAGNDRERDPVTAMMWLTVADSIAARAKEKSEIELTKVRRDMMPEQIADAQRRAAEWLREGEPKKNAAGCRSPKPQSAVVIDGRPETLKQSPSTLRIFNRTTESLKSW